MKNLELNLRMLWNQFKSINLSEFFAETSTIGESPIIVDCVIDNIDCKNLWDIRETYLGRCLALDPERVNKIRMVNQKTDRLECGLKYIFRFVLYFVSLFLVIHLTIKSGIFDCR